MKIAVKAGLLSAFIFPGAGHFLLKKHIVGVLLAGTAFAALFILMEKAIETALQIGEKIQSGEVQLNAAAIAELVSIHPTGDEAQVLNIATAVLFISWLIGMIDSYRVGRALEKKLIEQA